MRRQEDHNERKSNEGYLDRKTDQAQQFNSSFSGYRKESILTSDRDNGQRVPLPGKYAALPRNNAKLSARLDEIGLIRKPSAEPYRNAMATDTMDLAAAGSTPKKGGTVKAYQESVFNDGHDASQSQNNGKSTDRLLTRIGNYDAQVKGKTDPRSKNHVLYSGNSTNRERPGLNSEFLSKSFPALKTANGYDYNHGDYSDADLFSKSTMVNPDADSTYSHHTSLAEVARSSRNNSRVEIAYRQDGFGNDLFNSINSPASIDLSGISKCGSKQSNHDVNCYEKRKSSDGELSLSNFSFSSANESMSGNEGGNSRTIITANQSSSKESVGNHDHKLIPLMSDSNGIADHDVTDQDNLIEEIERSLKTLRDDSLLQEAKISSGHSPKSILDRADIILNRILLASSLSRNDISKDVENNDSDVMKIDNAPTGSVDLTRVTTLDLEETGSRKSVSDRSLGRPASEDGSFDKVFRGRFQSTPKFTYRYDHYDDEGSFSLDATDSSPRRLHQLAVDFNRKTIMKKCIVAWYKEYRRSSIETEEVVQKNNSRRLAKAWVKWTTVLHRKRKQRMRSVFVQWKQIHLQMKREMLTTGSSRRKEVKKEYYEWKFQFEMEQSDGFASFHYKLSLLTRSFQLWNVYVTERRVKKKMQKLARIRFEVQSTRKLFLHWRNCIGKSCFVKRQMNKELLLNVFNGWRKWTQYSKMLHKRHLSACKEYRSRAMMRAALAKWRSKLKARMAEKHHIIAMERRSFVLWRLQCRRTILRRQIAINHSNVVLMEKCFTPWMTFSIARLRKRNMFIKLVMKIQLKSMFQKWKDFTEKSAILRHCKTSFHSLRSSVLLKEAFSKWKHSHDVIKFKERMAEDRLKRIVRNAAMKWKNKIVKRHLNQKLIAASPFFEFLRLKALFMQWVREKTKADRDMQRANVIAAILGKSCKARVFTAWRLVTQEDHVIHHMVARKQRRDLARVFDAWRLVVTRNLVSVKYRKVKELERTQNIFFSWRERYLFVLKERVLRQSVEKNLLLRVISRWKDFVAEINHHRKDLSRRYLTRWQTNTEARVERRSRLQALEANRRIKLKIGFRRWLLKADLLKRMREENENEAINFCAYNSKRVALSRWRRQFHVHCIVSEYIEDKKFQCLDGAFRQWKDYVKHQIQDAIGRFTDRLEKDTPRSVRHHTLSESYASVDMPILRSSSGYFGSLPNVAKIGSPLPVSPLATARSVAGRDSPASLSPDYPFDRSPKSPLTGLYRSNTFSSPSDRGRTSSLERSRSVRERSKSPNSIPSSGSLSNKNKSPVYVPPLFTNSFKGEGDDDDSDEVYTELVRPSSLPRLENNDPLNQSTMFLQSDKSADDDSPASIFGHNMDEDAMSYYSFQSESVGVNREHFMSGAIRHWRHLPLSRTFRAWFKYTQERKIRRDLLLHFVSSRNTWTVKRVYLLWHRKLYCRLAVEKFYRTKMLQKHFKAVFTFTMQQRQKKDHNLVAKLHLRNMKINSVFQLWKRKYTTKRRLHSLVGRWQEAVHISEGDKSKSDQFLQRRKQRMLREAFLAWKQAMQNFAAAEELSTKLLIRRVIISWHRGASKSKELEKASQKVVNMRTSKVFFTWMKSFNSTKRAQLHYQNTQGQKFRTIFYTWLEWTKEEKALSKQVAQFQRRKNFKLVAQAFFIWSEEAERCKIADDHYRESLMIKVIEFWHEYTEQRLDLVIRLEDYQQSSVRTKTRNVFDWWKRSAICSRVFKERQQIQHRERQMEAFLQWRKNVRQRKSDSHYRALITKKAFHNWLQKCVNINKQRRVVVIAAKKWLSQTQAHLALEETAKIFFQERTKDLLQSTFMQWVDSAKGLKIARIHHEQHLTTSAINYWFVKTRRAKELREARVTVETIVENNLLAVAFEKWITFYKHVQKNDMVLENYLELKQQEILKLCLVNFRINALKGRSEKHCRALLQRKTLDTWLNAAYRSKALARIKERLLTITVRKYANIWRKRTKAVVGLESIADAQRKKKDTKDLKKRFQAWMLKTRGKTLARMCFQGNLLKSNFIRWRRRTQRKMLLRKTLESYQEKQKKKQLQEQFQTWKEKMKQLQKDKKMEEVHEQIARAHFRKSLMEKCFYGWRKECLVERMRMKLDLKLCAQYFSVWKDQSLGSNKAERAYDQMLLERSWKRWRKVKIKLKVIRAMEMHETRQQLSEVFSAWYNYTYIRRRALKEFELTKQNKIFRKWMQEYNKS
ncbi:uncharacterized protein LOC135688314 isoform X1 [Rhopilema esculentum]|uniref:uncharacterized protein LOC135688314 isoform X1 n=1 Tax=Rhopilema esculentum TaxID=499914 RepID=UPI0031CE1FD4